MFGCVRNYTSVRLLCCVYCVGVNIYLYEVTIRFSVLQSQTIFSKQTNYPYAARAGLHVNAINVPYCIFVLG